jgi:hypothetical protein
MSHRLRSSSLRMRSARLAVAAAAGLSSVLVIAPAAFADEAPAPGPDPTDTTTETPAPVETPTPPPVDTPTPPPVDETPTPVDETPTPVDPTPTPGGEAPVADAPPRSSDAGATAKSEVVVDAVAPNFGFQKFRVGVKVTDGSWVPEGTTTVGTTFTITETGPGVGGSVTYTCTTDASTVEPGSTASYCLNSSEGPRLKTAAVGGVVVDPDDPSAPGPELFEVSPGDTVTISQTTVRPNLVRTITNASIGPCVISPGADECPGSAQSTVLFDNPGLPPIAKDDHRTTGEGQAINITVLSNDDPVHGAPVTALDVVSDPGHGTAKVHGHLIKYTPDAGFTGKDTFDYTYATPNGTATATVTVTIVPGAVGVLPDTGGGDVRLLGLGMLLVASGGWLMAEGRRRPSHVTVD